MIFLLANSLACCVTASILNIVDKRRVSAQLVSLFYRQITVLFSSSLTPWPAAYPQLYLILCISGGYVNLCTFHYMSSSNNFFVIVLIKPNSGCDSRIRWTVVGA